MKTRFPHLAKLCRVGLLLCSVVSSVLVASLTQAQQADPTVDPATNPELPANDVPGKLTVQLSGTATANNETQLQVTPAAFDTGLVEIGETKTQSVVIKHAGGVNAAPIAIKAATLFGATPNEYSVNFNGVSTLNPGDQFPVKVTFTPTSPGNKSAGLRLAVEGLTAPVVILFKGESRYPLTSELKSSVQTINFGQIASLFKSTKVVTFKNDGEPSAPNIAVTGFAITGQAASAFQSNFQPKTLKPGESFQVVVTFKVGGTGYKQATATMVHNGNNDNIELTLEGTKTTGDLPPIEFSNSMLNGAAITRGTSVQFGPDNKLYVTEMNGAIKVFDVTRAGKDDYTATLLETITTLQTVPNHNDDGTPVDLGNKRLVTGFLVTGTAATPIIYAASSDPRQAAGPSGLDANLDTNSGILHKLTKSGDGWIKQDIVRGLPRSEENHVPNGIVKRGDKIYLLTGGHTNEGAPSNNFAFTPEYALSAALLEIDLGAIGTGTYDLPTLDDEDRAGVNDANDPFGGNDGKNQAKLIPNGPVKVYATGYRNAFDLLDASNGKLYTFDNGPNSPWGGIPINCSNQVVEGGGTHNDQLHVIEAGDYGGHPNPTRGSKNNTFNESNPQSPIEGPAFPGDCTYKPGGQGDGSLTVIKGSTNGLVEYTASNFGGQMQGDIIAVSFNKKVTRIELTANGLGVAGQQVLLSKFGSAPLDVTTTGDNGPFPGTLWVVDNLGVGIFVLEPGDF